MGNRKQPTPAPILPRIFTPLSVTETQFAAAFTEWDRRYREEPDRFVSEAHHLLKDTPETYGAACASYLLFILNEQAGNG